MSEGDSTRQDRTYFVTVMALMVVVIVSLAALWMLQRRACLAAQGELAAARAENGRLRGMLAQMVMSQGLEQGIKVAREDLPTQTVQWDGRARDVLVLSARTGLRLGLRPGDAILVSAPPATEASSEPTSQSSH